MSNAKRVLFVASEVAPFVSLTEIAQLTRSIAEKISESAELDLRVIMPRYGIISERKNRLHEVIRLSGSEVVSAGQKETLKVKVASVPGVRLQVYFIENTRYFKRKGAFLDKQGAPFEDSGERALFFGRAVFKTLQNLGWSPHIVHSWGWAASAIPYLYVRDEHVASVFQGARLIYTPDEFDASGTFPGALVQSDAKEVLMQALAVEHAHMRVLPPSGRGDGVRFSVDPTTWVSEALSFYEEVLGEVAA